MTKSRGIGRGGKRPGAGRKPLPSALQKAKAAEPADDLALIDAPESAKAMKGLALATLKQIMQHSERDAARVAAAREVLARADEEEAPAQGKKAQTLANAHRKQAEGGKFSAPPPPMANRIQ